MSRQESQSREDKQSLNEWRQVVESLAAFATTKGGIVRIGIGPKGEIVGVQVGKGTLEDLSNKIKQNPGILPPSLTIERLYREHPSLPRNPKIALAFYRTRLVEHWGTGTLRMADECERLGIKLEFLSESGFFMARFVKPQIAIPPSIKPKLNERQRKGLDYASKHGQITNRDYQKLCDISRRQALKDLIELVEVGLLIKAGEGRAVRYVMSSKDRMRD